MNDFLLFIFGSFLAGGGVILIKVIALVIYAKAYERDEKKLLKDLKLDKEEK